MDAPSGEKVMLVNQFLTSIKFISENDSVSYKWIPNGAATASKLPSGLASILTMVPFPQPASWVRRLTFSAVMVVLGSGTGVPASTAGIGVGVEVNGMDVGIGANVGAGVASGAQATNTIRKDKRKHNRLFIFNSFSVLNNFNRLEIAMPVFYPWSITINVKFP